MSCRVCWHLLLVVQMGDVYRFRYVLTPARQHAWSARPPNIMCGNETGLFYSKNSNKIPPRKQKIKSELQPNHKRCKSEYHPATLSVLECRHSNTRIGSMFRKKSRHTINPPPNRLIRNCPNKRFGGWSFLRHKAYSHSKGRSSPKLWTWLSPIRSVGLTYHGGACETPPSFHISYRVCRNWHTDRC